MNNFGDKLKRFFGCAAYGFGITIETVSNGKGILGNIAELSKGIGTEFLADVSESEFESFGNWLETHKFNKRFSRTLKSLTCAPDIWAAIVEIINGNATKRIKDTKHDKHSGITAGSVAAISRVWLNPYKKDYIVNSCKNSEKYTKLDEDGKTCVRDILSTACDIYLEAAFEEFLNKEDKILASVLISALGSKIDNYTEEIRAFTERHRIAEGTQLSYGKVQVTRIVEETFALVCSWCGNNIAAYFVKDRSEDNKYICKSCGTACFMISHTANADEIADKISNKFAEFTAELYKKIDEDGKTTRARIDSAEKNIINIVPNVQRLKAALKADYISKEEIKRLADYISRYAPDHLLVRFVNAFLSPSKDAVSKFLDDFPIGAGTEEDVDLITDVLIRYMQATWIETLSVFIERAYKQNKRLKSYSEVRDRFFKQSSAVDDGTYDLTYKRDVFIAYSTEDLQYIRDLVTELEKAEIECFVAYRNLPNCFGEDFKKDICLAMQHCSVLLFASSRNSRHRKCDAVWELQTWNDEQPQKPRFEYLIENYSAEDNDYVCKKIKRMLPLSYATLGDYGTIIDVIDKALPNPYGASGGEYPANSSTVDKHEAVPVKTIQSKSPVIAKTDDKPLDPKTETAKSTTVNLPTPDKEKAIHALIAAAESGDADAQYELGKHYYNGEGVTKNLDKAFKWVKLAADKDHTKAQFMLGYCYYKGNGVTQDYKEAVKWFKLAADKGDADAQDMLGYCYYKGNGVDKNSAEAVKWFRLAAEQGLSEAQYSLGLIYYYGRRVKKDLYEAFKWFKKAADNGHIAAQGLLGDCYYYGSGVEKNYAEAIKWFTKAADKDHTKAQFMLGYCYYKGNGVTQDYKEAVKWFKLAADKGDADAQYMLGYCYYKGNGVTQDYKEAVKWFKLAADKGDADAQFMLGECYYWGRGVKKDRKEAVSQYSWLAEKNTEAQFRLGYCYQHGKGTTKDLKKAISCYNSAAKKGHAGAQYILGLLYYSGRGVTKDKKEAFKWIRSAALSGSEDAFKFLKWASVLIEAGENYLCLGKCYYEGKSVNQSFDKAFKYYCLSAKNGNAVAQYMIGNIYYFGGVYEPGVYEPFDGRFTSFTKFTSVEKNHIEAVKWFKLAAANGHAEAQFMLGECYYNGYGVDKNRAEAVKWYRLAADNGSAVAKRYLENIK